MCQLQAIDLNGLENVYLPEIRALDFNEQDKTFLVGTRGGEILEVSTQGKKLATLVRGHQAEFSKSKGAGIACHPKEQLFASCGMDRRIRVWSDEK
jgi:WD40 repeat protein